MHRPRTLKEWRQRVGITQERLAKESGLSTDLISKVENNQLRLTLSAAKKIGKVIEVEPNELQKGHTVGSLDKLCSRLEYKLEREEYELVDDSRKLANAWQVISYIEYLMSELTKSTPTDSEDFIKKEKERKRRQKVWSDANHIIAEYLESLIEISEKHSKMIQKKFSERLRELEDE